MKETSEKKRSWMKKALKREKANQNQTYSRQAHPSNKAYDKLLLRYVPAIERLTHPKPNVMSCLPVHKYPSGLTQPKLNDRSPQTASLTPS
mmetsp:Transcript_54735/g.132910  ORF Transcript_54735/g.132910 Transcript_54735/m.132910 type:complete len:91 (+) Transcript_54735:316-588(+)